MSRIDDIFLRVRDTLNDPLKQRWSDDTLLRLLNDGITDIAKQTSLFKNSIAISIVNGQAVYNLPSNLLRTSHITYDWEARPMRTSGWMDKHKETDWRLSTSDNDIEIFVFDEIKRRQIRVYPRPFGFATNVYTSNSPYGVLVAISDYSTPESIYGVTVSVADPEVSVESFLSYYGVIGDITEDAAFIVYYTEYPALLADITGVPELDECFDIALKYFITALALRNDLDAQNRAMGAEELQFYSRELEVITGLTVSDSVDAPYFESSYNGIG